MHAAPSTQRSQFQRFYFSTGNSFESHGQNCLKHSCLQVRVIPCHKSHEGSIPSQLYAGHDSFDRHVCLCSGEQQSHFDKTVILCAVFILS